MTATELQTILDREGVPVEARDTNIEAINHCGKRRWSAVNCLRHGRGLCGCPQHPHRHRPPDPRPRHRVQRRTGGNMSAKVERWVEAMTRNAERERIDIDERIKRLCAEDTRIKAAIFEMFEKCYESGGTYLCNFSKAIDHNGNKHDMREVIAEMDRHLEAEYKRLTG